MTEEQNAKFDISDAVSGNVVFGAYILSTAGCLGLVTVWATMMRVSQLEVICLGYIGNAAIFALLNLAELTASKPCSRLRLVPAVALTFGSIVCEAIIWLYNRWAVAFHLLKMADWLFVLAGFIACRIGLFREESLSPASVLGSSGGLFLAWYYPGLFSSFVSLMYYSVVLSFAMQLFHVGYVVVGFGYFQFTARIVDTVKLAPPKLQGTPQNSLFQFQRQIHRINNVTVSDLLLKVSLPLSFMTLLLVFLESYVVGRKLVFMRLLEAGPKTLGLVFTYLAFNAVKAFSEMYLNVKCRLETFLIVFANHQLALWFILSLFNHEISLSTYGTVGGVIIIGSALWYIKQYMTEDEWRRHLPS